LDERIARCREAAARVRPLYDDGRLLEERPREAGLWMLVGLPSAGKSTFAEVIRAAGREIVEVDRIREENGWEIGDPEWQEDAYRIAYERLEGALDAGVVFESTGLWEPARRRCREIAGARGLPVRALVVASDPGLCARREAERRPGNPFLARVLDAYAGAISVLPEEGYASLHWLDEAERDRLARAWRRA
jgi:predicted kinase